MEPTGSVRARVPQARVSAGDRVVIFLDGSNVYHRLREALGRSRIGSFDYERFVAVLGSSRRLVDVRFYWAMPDQTKEPNLYPRAQRFVEYLRSIGVRIRFGELRYSGARKYEKAVDVMLASDMLSLAFADSYDTAILVSSDGDFVPTVRWIIQSTGKRVEVALFSRGSNALRKASSAVIRVDAESFCRA